jgi:hypothetical protein
MRHKTGFQKNILIDQDSRQLLLINAEDPRQYTYLRNLQKKNPAMEMWWEKIEMTCENFMIRFLLILSLVGA